MAALIEFFRENDLCEYGAVVSGDVVRAALGISQRDGMTFAEYQAASLREMSAIQEVKNVLLDEGKYLGKSGDAYRVFLPSENLAQVAKYEEAANRKLKRGRRLLSSTPPQYRGDTHNDAMKAARLHAKNTQRARGRV